MRACLVDVLDVHDRVLHVFPIAVTARDGTGEAECVQEAVRAAAHLHLVPEKETESLRGRVHVSRGGQLTPLGDVLQVRQQTQERVEQRIRTRAYFLWQREGFPEHRADEHWYQACDIEGQG